MGKIVIILWITFSLYFWPFVAVIADLWSGVRKAKINGVARSSYGFRRTIDKLARYYNLLLALTVVDAMHMSSVWYLDTYYSYTKLPMFPFITLLGAIGICIIEIKSIYEKAEDKVRIENVANMAGKIITNKDDMSEIIKAVVTYMKEPEVKKELELEIKE
jgi:hypothetical protein